MHAILEGIVETGNRAAGPGRTILAITVDNWLIDEIRPARRRPREDREPEPDEEDNAMDPRRP